MPLEARRPVRRMRGGAQAHLIEASDGHWYVVKFLNNPQHRRILVNELVVSHLLRHLGVATPIPAVVEFRKEFLSRHSLTIEIGGRATRVAAGRHFGSRFPGDPARLAVYDFLPDALLGRVRNLRDFLAVLVVDKWVANADARQAVFYRDAGGAQPGFVALMIDQGFSFNGPHWDFPDSPLQGLYFRRGVYEKVRSLSDFQPWFDRVTHLSEDVIDLVFKQVPGEWIDGEEDAFEKLLEQLYRRRTRVPDLLRACRDSHSNPFPLWR